MSTRSFFVAQSLLRSSMGLIGYDTVEGQSSYTNSLGYETAGNYMLHSRVQPSAMQMVMTTH